MLRPLVRFGRVSTLGLGVALGASVLGCPAGGAPVVSDARDGAAASGPASEAMARLERELVETERALDAGADEDARALLARRRLVLTIAIALLSRRAQAGDVTAPDVEGLMASIEQRMKPLARPTPSEPAPPPGGDDADGDGDLVADEPVEDPGDNKERAGDEKDSGTSTAPSKHRADKPRKTIRLEEISPEGNPKDKGGAFDAKTPDRVEKAAVADEARPRGLMSAVSRQLTAMEGCLEEVDGDVKLDVTVRLDAGGSVRLAKVTGVTGAPASCVAGVLRRVRVHKHDGGARVVRFPLFFQRD